MPAESELAIRAIAQPPDHASRRLAVPKVGAFSIGPIASEDLPHGVADSLRAHQTIGALGERDRSLGGEERRYALAMKGSNDGPCDWDMRKGEIYISPRIH